MKKLTKRTIDAFKPQKTRFILWDSEIAGFGVVVLPSGTRSFVLNYRNSQKRERRLTLGRYGVLTVDQARKMALTALALVRDGDDPVSRRQQASMAPDVRRLADRYVSDHVRRHNAQTTQAEFERLIKRHIVPSIGHLRVSSVTRPDIIRLHKSMESTPRQANHVLSVLSKMFSLAEIWGYRSEGSNPTRSVPRYREIERERFLSQGELNLLGSALTEAESIGLPWSVNECHPNAKHLAKKENRRSMPNPQALLAIRLLLLTGARVSEIIGLEWQHVDFEGMTIALPSRKGRARKPHPISEAAYSVLKTASKEAIGIFVCPSPNDPRRHISMSVLQKCWRRLRWRAELKDVRLHDLRHTVGTYASQTGANAFLISHVLRQKTLAVTNRYVNPDSDPIRETFEVIGERIQRGLDGR